MSAKTDTEVIIGGQVLTLSGYESEEYLQRVASYINNKLNEYNKIDSYKRQSSDRRNVLIQLNIADDYFKAKDQIEVLKQDLKAKENELYDLKHELIATQIKLENTSKSLKETQDRLQEDSKELVRMEAELKEHKKKIERRKIRRLSERTMTAFSNHKHFILISYFIKEELRKNEEYKSGTACTGRRFLLLSGCRQRRRRRRVSWRR